MTVYLYTLYVFNVFKYNQAIVWQKEVSKTLECHLHKINKQYFSTILFRVKGIKLCMNFHFNASMYQLLLLLHCCFTPTVNI